MQGLCIATKQAATLSDGDQLVVVVHVKEPRSNLLKIVARCGERLRKSAVEPYLRLFRIWRQGWKRLRNDWPKAPRKMEERFSVLGFH